MTLTKEDKRLIRKVLNIAYQIISEEVEGQSDTIIKETLFDDWVEYNNGGYDYYYKEITNRLENDN